MIEIGLCFSLHTGPELCSYPALSIGKGEPWFDWEATRQSAILAAERRLLPFLEFWNEQIGKQEGAIRLSFYLSGPSLDTWERFSPEVIEVIKPLVRGGFVELLGGVEGHSFAYAYSPEELKRQALVHRDRLGQLFDAEPRVFFPPELRYHNFLAYGIRSLGYEGMLISGQPLAATNQLYAPAEMPAMRLIPVARDAWDTLGGFANAHPDQDAEGIALLCFDLREPACDFSAPQLRDSWEQRLYALIQKPGHSLKTASELLSGDRPTTALHGGGATADFGWNALQWEALNKLLELREAVLDRADAAVLEDWTRLQASDYLRAMGEGSPIRDTAYICMLNIISDFQIQLRSK